MATTEFLIGAYAKVDHDNRTHKTKDGQYIVVIKTTMSKKADFGVWPTGHMTSRVARYVCRGRLERRGRHEAELDASRVVHAGGTLYP